MLLFNFISALMTVLCFSITFFSNGHLSFTTIVFPLNFLMLKLNIFFFIDGPSNTSNQDIQEAMSRASWHLLVQMYDSAFLSRPLFLGFEFILGLVVT
jgi:hypothetical protein